MSKSLGDRSVFDPYRRWLGIPAEQRPPTYYQILGVAPDEQDAEIIEEAAMRQTAHVRTYQAGPHAEEAKKLLGEIAMARATLLKPEKRRVYDANLRASAKPADRPTPEGITRKARETARLGQADLEAWSFNGAPAESEADAPVEPAYRARGRGASWFTVMVLGLLVIILTGAGLSAWLLLARTEQPGPTPVAVVLPAPTTAEVKVDPQPTAKMNSDPPAKIDPDPVPMPPPKKEDDPKPAPKMDPPAPKVDPLPEPKDERTPVPDEEAQATAEKGIKTTYKTEYALKLPGNQRALADKMLRRGVELDDEPEVRYVLYREAHELALKANDYLLALQAAEEMGYDYQVDDVLMKVQVLEKASQGASPLASKRLVERAFLILDEAVRTDHYDAMPVLFGLTKTLAKRTNDKSLIEQVNERTKEIERQQTDYAVIAKARAVLKEKPGDPAACLTLGKHLCLIKSDWPRGLPLLSASGDPVLKEMARLELANPTEWKAQVDLGDRWHDAGRAERGPGRSVMLRRSVYWYKQALPVLEGGPEKHVLGRLEALNTLLGKEQPSRWEQFDTSYASPIGSHLRVHGLRGLRCKDKYAGAIDIQADVWIEDDLIISAAHGAVLHFQPKKPVAFFRPPFSLPNSPLTKPGSPVPFPIIINKTSFNAPIYFDANEWHSIRWLITENGMGLWLDGQSVYDERKWPQRPSYALTAVRPISLRSKAGSYFDVKSVTVQQK